MANKLPLRTSLAYGFTTSIAGLAAAITGGRMKRNGGPDLSFDQVRLIKHSVGIDPESEKRAIWRWCLSN